MNVVESYTETIAQRLPLTLATLFFCCLQPIVAQQKPSSDSKKDLIKATETYKASLKELLALYEADIKKTLEKSNKLKELYAEGIISKRDLEESERAITDAKIKAEETKKRMEAADHLLVESLAEIEETKQKPILPGQTIKTMAYIRYKGTGKWSLSDAPKIEAFFTTRFKRQLPISAFGQSDLHTRWGYNHRNALDVAIHPDSIEGQALMEYLKSFGIPFFAFRRAVPGSATGPHIHIGNPSHKVSN
jgi:hypothetical protein